MKKQHPLKRWREKHGLTLAHVADVIGVSPSFIWMVEADQRGLSLSKAAHLSKETGIPLEDFVREPA